MIAGLEAVARDAWPPRECVDLDGWVLCEGGGFTRRTSSVQPVGAGRLPLPEKIDRCEAFYGERGRPAVFKLTAESIPRGLDVALEGRGYKRSDPTSVQTLALAKGDFAADPSVRIDGMLRMAWLRDCTALWSLGARQSGGLHEILQRIEGRAEPCAFASLTQDRRACAVGLGVVRGVHLFLGEIATRPDRRREGLGRRVVESLLAWGAERGAETALLQVVVANEAARALYAELGFEEQYRYWYREAPAAAGPAAAQ